MRIGALYARARAQAQINELRRTVEKYHGQHKNLKRKVTQLARRLGVIEPFVYADERDLFYFYVLEFREFLENRGNKRWPKETGLTETP